MQRGGTVVASGPTARGARDHDGCLRPVPRLGSELQGSEPATGRRSGSAGGGPAPTELHTAEPAENRVRRDGGAAAPVEDRGRRRYMRQSLWRTGPTQRRPVVDRGLADIKPAAGVMDLRRNCQSQNSDSGSGSLHIAVLQQPAEPRHSLAPTAVRSKTSDGQDCTTMGTTTSRVERASDQDAPLLEF